MFVSTDTICKNPQNLSVKYRSWRLCYHYDVVVQGLEGEDDSAIGMLSDHTAKITSAVRWVYKHHATSHSPVHWKG